MGLVWIVHGGMGGGDHRATLGSSDVFLTLIYLICAVVSQDTGSSQQTGGDDLAINSSSPAFCFRTV